MTAPDTKGDGTWWAGRWYPPNDPVFGNRPPPTKESKVIVIRSFSEADLREIKASLAEYGVDLDAVTVGKFVPGARWWLPDDSAVRRPLPDALQDMSWYYDPTRLPHLEKPLTPIQLAEDLQKALPVFENVLAVLNQIWIDRPDWTDDDHDADGMLYRATARYIARLQERIAELRAMGRRSDQNARKGRSGYWHELTRLWRAIANSAGPLRRKSLGRFLLACSRALFPEVTAREIHSFLSNRSRKKSPRRNPEARKRSRKI
jgi:hypothetical protein